jgi:hypothetical protein
MLRRILGVVLGLVVGLVVGLLVIFTVEGVGHTLFPPDAGVNLTDPREMSQVMAHVSSQAKVMILLAWTLGLMFATGAADLIAGRRPLAGRIVAALLLALAAWTAATTHYPAWLAVGAWAGGLIGAVLAERAFGRPRRA